MKQKLISIFLLLSLLLPMGIGLSHAFHEHETLLCQSKSEFHIHAEPTACDQIHFINHTLSYDGIQEYYLNPILGYNTSPILPPALLVTTVLVVESDRGPPAINV